MPGCCVFLEAVVSSQLKLMSFSGGRERRGLAVSTRNSNGIPTPHTAWSWLVCVQLCQAASGSVYTESFPGVPVLHRILCGAVCLLIGIARPQSCWCVCTRVSDRVQEEKNVLFWSQDQGNGMCLSRWVWVGFWLRVPVLCVSKRKNGKLKQKLSIKLFFLNLLSLPLDLGDRNLNLFCVCVFLALWTLSEFLGRC